MPNSQRTFYEIKPGPDTLRYLLSYGYVSWLSQRASKRKHRLFVELNSNIDRHILTEGLFEKGVIELLEDVIQQVGHRKLMIDIGANIGNHSVSLAHLFEKVHSVEPHPILFHILTANILRNNIGHATLHNFGLANEDTSATLAVPSENHGVAKVKERSILSAETFGLTSEEFENEFSVELKSAEEFVAQFGDALDEAFIKIDVEGMEQEIISAIVPVLNKHKPLVGFEWFPKAQPELTQIVSNIDGYELWGIHLNDVGKNLLWRSFKMMFRGRTYQLQRIDPNNLDEVYPLALLVPNGKLG